ncbi:MAG TPA: Druantia anti-phage system protein DruA [Mucilaginibacter sp.]|jgi:hypothetical protein|nr:Druantia anti-phage system protein DruA [Mucilaginibacter sp.]
MIEIDFHKRPQERNHSKVEDFVHFDLRGKSSQEKVKLLILRDLWNVNWNIRFGPQKITVSPPEEYTKSTVKSAMLMKRLEILHDNKKWIKEHIKIARQNLCSGVEMLSSEINPVIEVCRTQKDMNLFRIFRYYWSSPYSEYVGRRIKLIIRDYALPNKPVIGIAALGSPIIHIPERDNWIGWDKQTRTKNLIYTMDAYVVGALPPYNNLLGGKLISYILASNEVRDIYKQKYRDRVTLIDGKVSDNLAGLFTTSLYGQSSQYNRISYNNKLLYVPIGETKGYGTLHLSKQTIEAMIDFLKSKDIDVKNKFGDGPSWVMRVIRTAGEELGFDADFLLKHSFKRNIYFVPLVKNYSEFLNDKSNAPIFEDMPLSDLVNFWKQRWFARRKSNPDVLLRTLEFTPESFNIEF